MRSVSNVCARVARNRQIFSTFPDPYFRVETFVHNRTENMCCTTTEGKGLPVALPRFFVDTNDVYAFEHI